MTTLNHANLSTSNVPRLAEFFCSIFGFSQLKQRADKFALLRNRDGFLLTLMYDKHVASGQQYPPTFHIGFLQPTASAVDRVYEELTARNYAAPTPAKLQRGGPPAYGFYCEAPGGIVVEVSAMEVEASA
ncbi:MAG: VOC family protein [Acidobacteria bacterium]|nr:VOC family protein [Acidobacteriota bacterium]